MKSSATPVSDKNGHSGNPLPKALQDDLMKNVTPGDDISAEPAKQPTTPQIRLLPIDGSDMPVLANYTTLELSPGVAYLNFGFIEPSVIEALQGAIQSQSPLPERISGRMAVRVALGLDQLHALHRQLGLAISGIENVARQQLNAYSEAMEAKKKQ